MNSLMTIFGWFWTTMLEHPLLVIFSPIYAFPVTWVLFVFSMSLQKHIKKVGWKNFSLTEKLCYVFFGGPFVVAGYLLDYYVNLIVMTILLLQLPKFKSGRYGGFSYVLPVLTTERLQEYYRLPEGHFGPLGRWRIICCRGICNIFLHPFDECHCC